MNSAFKSVVGNGSMAANSPVVGGISLGNTAPLNLHKSPVVSVQQQKPMKQNYQQQMMQPTQQQLQNQQLPPLGLPLPQQPAKQKPLHSSTSGQHQQQQQFAPHSQAAKVSTQHNPQNLSSIHSVPIQAKPGNVANQQQQLLQMAQQQILGQPNQQEFLQMQATTTLQQQQLLQQQQQLFKQQQQQQTQLGYQPGQFKP